MFAGIPFVDLDDFPGLSGLVFVLAIGAAAGEFELALLLGYAALKQQPIEVNLVASVLVGSGRFPNRSAGNYVPGEERSALRLHFDPMVRPAEPLVQQAFG